MPSSGRLFALTRGVSPRIGQCELVHLPRVAIDVEQARAQHRAYEETLASLGCHVVSLPPDLLLPDSVFVEDTAIVLAELAIMTRPGVESRRPETTSVAREMAKHRPLAFIEPPGTLEGGDVLQIRRRLYVGSSDRSNGSGIAQLEKVVSPHGYAVTPVPVTGCLHLKSAVTVVGPNTLLINPRWVDPSAFGSASVLEIDPAEPLAANGLLVGTTVIYPRSFPRTRQRLEDRGVDVLTIDMSELQKAEGAVTCCSLIFEADPERA